MYFDNSIDNMFICVRIIQIEYEEEYNKYG